MLKKIALTVSLIVVAATAVATEASATKPPRKEHCEWIKKPESNLYDWLKNRKHKEENWVCVSSENKGFNGPSGGFSAGNSSGSSTTTTTASTGKGNNGIGTPNGSKTDGGDPPGGGNTGNDGNG